MRAMLLEQTGPIDDAGSEGPLRAAELPSPEPGPGELLVRVRVCGVCHTELDEIEGRAPPRLPVVPGHQVVGEVVGGGPGTRPEIGSRVGVAWIWSACGDCDFCATGLENLCPGFVATGRDRDGGYAELMTVPAGFVHPIPTSLDDAAAAPLLCAGAIGYRSLDLTGLEDDQRLGLTGFGASGHLVLQMARHRYPGSPVYVFARSERARDFARELGAAWAGGTDEEPPHELHAVIDTTPAWRPVLAALAALRPGGRLVVNAIRKQDDDAAELTAIDYPRHLWLEKEIKSVANVTRSDVAGMLELAAEAELRPEVETYPLADANRALRDLSQGSARGAKVLVVG